jgi:hypothetical protein
MKTALCVLPLIVFAITVSKAQQIDAEHQKKAEWIIQRMALGKPLPAGINDGTKSAQKTWGKHHYSFSYRTIRMMNGQQADSVFMDVFIQDTLKDLEFDEHYIERTGGITDYHYNIQKGDLTYAYSATPLPDSLQQEPIYNKDGTVSYPFNTKVDSTLMIDKKDSLWTYDAVELEKHKERDRKGVTFYRPMLLKSIDELYDLLNK